MKLLSVLLVTVLMLASGCGTWNLNLGDKAGYTSGVIAAAVYMDTKDRQSEDVNMAIVASYRTLVRVTGGEVDEGADLMDILGEEVSKLITENSDLVTVSRIALLYFDVAKQKLYAEVGGSIAASEHKEILLNFRAGIDSVLAIYQPSGAGIDWDM